MPLPPPLFNFASHNENASVERLLIETLGPHGTRPMRVVSVAGCGTHAITMCGSPDVAHVDAVDVAPPQLALCSLVRAAALTLESSEQLAVFIGNSGDHNDRCELWAQVRDAVDPEWQEFWVENEATVSAGILRCGGAERCYAIFREHLPSADLAELAGMPAAIHQALAAGITMENQRAFMNVPKAAMNNIVEHGVPAIAAQLSARLVECETAPPDFAVELIVRGAFAMDPISSRPCFLQPRVFAEIQQNGCGPDRLSFHEGALQQVAGALAEQRGAYDLADMSNILDLSADKEAVATVRGVAAAVRKGGALLCRSHKPAGALAPIFEQCGLRVDAELSDRARAAETSFFMNDVCVAFT